jgi:hypothetical protein
MAASLEETLISVCQQALVENARTVALENRNFRFDEPAGQDCVCCIFNLKITNCAVSNRIPRQASGSVGASGKEGHAISAAPALHRCCGGRKGPVLTQTGNTSEADQSLEIALLRSPTFPPKLVIAPTNS